MVLCARARARKYIKQRCRQKYAFKRHTEAAHSFGTHAQTMLMQKGCSLRHGVVFFSGVLCAKKPNKRPNRLTLWSFGIRGIYISNTTLQLCWEFRQYQCIARDHTKPEQRVSTLISILLLYFPSVYVIWGSPTRGFSRANFAFK